LANLSKLHPISVRRNPPNHLENSFLDFFFTNSWPLEAGYLKSLLFERNRITPTILRLSSAKRNLQDSGLKPKKMKKLR